MAAAAAAAAEECPEQGTAPIADRAVAADAVAARTFLGSMSEELRAAVAVAAVVGRHSRTMLDRRAGVRLLLSWSSAKCAMGHIAMMAGSSGVTTGDAEGASESRVGAVGPHALVVAGIVVVAQSGVETNIAEWESGHMKFPMPVGCIATCGSCLDTAQGTVFVQGVLVGILGNPPETEVDHSYRIVVRCQSSSFPSHLGDSLEQH